MIPLVLALPDQPRQIILAIEHRIHPQPVRASRYNPRHHRPGKVHRPKTGREPLHKPTLPPVPVGSQMKCHIERSEEHTSELQSLMRISYAVFCLKKKTQTINKHTATSSHSSQHEYNKSNN